MGRGILRWVVVGVWLGVGVLGGFLVVSGVWAGSPPVVAGGCVLVAVVLALGALAWL